MDIVSFVFGFLTVGIFGAKTLAETVESLPSEQIGATASLFLLCFGAAVISTLSYTVSSRRLSHPPRLFRALLGGVIAAGVFCAFITAPYAVQWLGYGPNSGDWMLLLALLLALVLPSLASWWWALLNTKTPARGD